MKRILIASVLVVGLSGAIALAEPPSATYAFTGGRWWDGAGYVSKTMYTQAGVLRSVPPPAVDQTIDLGGRYVIPPLAEGHNHWLEAEKVDQYVACYLADGVFYVRDMGNAPEVVDQFRDRVNLPTSVDFVTAMQGFTGPDSHPIEIIDYFVQSGVLPSTWKRPYDPEAEFVVRTEKDVDDRFKLLLVEHPSYVKAFLSYSEEYQRRLDDPAMYGNHRGMDPKLLPHLAQLTHAAGLRLAVHIYTLADFRSAVLAGADDIAHLPGAAPETNLPINRYLLTAADAELAHQKGVTVTTTIHDVIGFEDGEDAAVRRKWRDQVIIPNLKLLRQHGVPILIGSDHFRHSSLQEMLALESLGIFSDRELMQMDTYDTVRAVFPDRKLGKLVDGYEANFLVLDRDPMQSLANLKSIYLRVKQGRGLSVPDWALKRASLGCIRE